MPLPTPRFRGPHHATAETLCGAAGPRPPVGGAWPLGAARNSGGTRQARFKGMGLGFALTVASSQHTQDKREVLVPEPGRDVPQKAGRGPA